MLTGDNAGVACAIADQMESKRSLVVSHQKKKPMKFINCNSQEKVALVGDGITMLLPSSSMGLWSWNDIAIESADLVLTTNNL